MQPPAVSGPDPEQPVIASLLSPDGALGPDDTLSLRVTDGTGAPRANAPVTFSAGVGGHLLSATSEGPPSATITVQTGADGVAKVYVFGKDYQP